MTTRLHQIIALEGGAKESVPTQIERIKREFGKEELFKGLSRTYQPKDEDGEVLPPEAQRVQLRAEDLLRQAAKVQTRLWDLTATREETNAHARADVTLPGEPGPLLRNVPATVLLYLERELVKLAALIKALPVLDPAQPWRPELDQATGCWVTEAVETRRTKKVPRNHVMAEATAQHPAQVQVYMEDEPVGRWRLVNFSGALPATRVGAILERLDVLTAAVRSAREEANSAEVLHDSHLGEEVFGYLLAVQ